MIGGTLAALMLLALPNIGIINDSLSFNNLIAIAMVVALTLELSINVSFNPTRAIIADITPDGNQHTKGYTLMQTIYGSFGVLAYAIGAVWENYFLIYFGVVLVFLFTIIPPIFIEEPKTLEKVEDDQDEDSASKANMSAFLKISFASAFSWLGVQSIDCYTTINS